MSRIDFVTGAPEKYMHLVQELTVIPEHVESLLAGRSSRDLQHAPEGGWSPARVLAHMISYARHNGHFIRQIAWMTNPERRAWDEEDEVSREGLVTTNPATLLELLNDAVGDTIELLSHTPDAQWGRPGIVPGYGRRSLRQQLRAHIDHLNDHVNQLETLLAPATAAASATA